MHCSLQIKYMAPQEVEPAQERGMVIIDIRPEGDYDEVKPRKASL